MNIPRWVKLWGAAVALLALAAVGVHAQGRSEAGIAARLFRGLTDAVREKALAKYDDKQVMQAERPFPGGDQDGRGVLLTELTDEQRGAVDELLNTFFSPAGQEKAALIRRQPHGPGNRSMDPYLWYIKYYNEPARGENWAFRIEEHHLSVIQRYGPGSEATFGPIQLGANTPRDTWDNELAIVRQLHQSLSDAQRMGVVNPIDAMPGAEVKSLTYASLTDAQKALARQLWEARVAMLSDSQRERLAPLVERSGGIASAKIAFYGEPREYGDRFVFSLANEGVYLNVDWRSSHPHSIIRAGL